MRLFSSFNNKIRPILFIFRLNGNLGHSFNNSFIVLGGNIGEKCITETIFPPFLFHKSPPRFRNVSNIQDAKPI